MKKSEFRKLIREEVRKVIREGSYEFSKWVNAFVNPVITKISAETEMMDEGCLSIPDVFGRVKRATALKLEARNQNGRIFKMKAEGLLAQIIQHEIDHLDGVLFKDKAEKIRIRANK